MTDTGPDLSAAGVSWRRGLMAATAVTGLFAAYVFLTGGFDVRIAGVPVRSRSWERPATIAACLAAVLIWVHSRRLSSLSSAVHARRLPGWLTAAASAWVLAAGLAFGTFAAGGADSSGYVSQAVLFANGALTAPVPREAWMTWPDVPATLTPLGYTLDRTGTTLSPIYPPGLPLLMAPLARIHASAVFLVVPLCAAIAVWLCYRLGVLVGAPLMGALVALLLSVSPTFLSQTVQPMSDVPVTAFWLAALVASRQPQGWAPAVAGAAASVAILIRPNLAPLAVFVVAAAAWTPGRWAAGRGLQCAVAMGPGLILLGVIQQARYGSPLSSGYGRFDELFSLGHIGPNLARYPRWLTETHTPAIWLWLLAPVWFVRAPPPVRAVALIAYAFALAVFAAYLPYIYFRPEESFYTRFLLPAIPLMLVLSACTLLEAAGRITQRFAAVTVVVAGLVLAVALAKTSREWGVYGLRDVERKYPDVGAYVRDWLPERSVVLAMQHSGSVRYYAGRHILRWDMLDRASLGPAIEAVRRAGYTPFAALDRDEAEEFRRRFAAGSPEALSRMVPVAAFGATDVYMWK